MDLSRVIFTRTGNQVIRYHKFIKLINFYVFIENFGLSKPKFLLSFIIKMKQFSSEPHLDVNTFTISIYITNFFILKIAGKTICGILTMLR